MAKPFTFRFESLLRLRERRENEHKRAVAARLREIRALEEGRDALLERIRQQTDETRDALQSDAPNFDELKLGRHWMLRLRRGVMDAEAALKAHQAMLGEERRRLAEAAKETKVLARLKEKRHSEFRAELDRREQLELDEMNVSRYARAAAAGEGRAS